MTYRKVLAAAAIGLSLALAQAAPTMAQTLRIAEGASQAPLRVPLNRAVVLESAVPFGELSVANPLIADIATLSERSVYVLGKAPGRTTLTLLGVDGRLISNVEIQVTPDIAEFKERLRELMPGEAIEVRTANDGLVLSGVVSSAQRVSAALEIAERYAPGRVLNLMAVGGSQQVQLKVRFAEVSRSVSKDLGSIFGFGGLTNANAATIGNVAGLSDLDLVGRNPAIGATIFGGSVAVDVALEALETKGLVRTLAEPNLVAISGQTASFLAGGEVPVPVISNEAGSDAVSVDFRPFGVSLNFLPTVVNKQAINLQIDAEVSEVDESNGTTINGDFIPAFSTRRTSTVVELADGQSFAIGGLLSDSFSDNVQQAPWLGDLPILGTLFRSSGYQRRQTELVIVISAHLVHPVHGDVLALPTDRIRPPTENELFLYGRLEGSPAATLSTRSEAAAQDFSGNYGYVLD